MLAKALTRSSKGRLPISVEPAKHSGSSSHPKHDPSQFRRFAGLPLHSQSLFIRRPREVPVLRRQRQQPRRTPLTERPGIDFPMVSAVTGKLDSGASALVFDKMEMAVSGILDLWGYRDFSDPGAPLKFILGCSTVCAVRENMASHPGRMKSRYRGVIAVARLVEPYCVWLR